MLRDRLDTRMELTIDNLDIGLVATRYTVSKRVGLLLGLLLGTKVASIDIDDLTIIRVRPEYSLAAQ